ncbi:MAG: Flp family type IVb pilin [Rhodothalassiaceae bacterium]
MFKLIRKLRKDQKGATAIEYGLIAALIAVAAIGAMTALGGSLQQIFTTASSQLNTANTAAQSGAGSGAGTTP